MLYISIVVAESAAVADQFVLCAIMSSAQYAWYVVSVPVLYWSPINSGHLHNNLNFAVNFPSVGVEGSNGSSYMGANCMGLY